MMVYIGLLIITVFLAFLSRKAENKISSKIIFACAILIMSFVAGIRWDVGTDFLMYNEFFEVFKDHMVFSNKLEPMFILFCYIPGHFFETSAVTFFLIGLFIYTMIFRTCKETCKYYDMSIFIFICFGLFFSSLNIVRQWMAIALLLKLYMILDEKIGIKHIVLIVLAFLCHYTSIFAVPFILCCKFINKEKTRLLLIAIFIGLKLIIDNLLYLIFKFISGITFFAKYNKYFLAENHLNASILIPTICLMVYVFYLIFLRNKMSKIEKKEEQKINTMLNVLVFAFGFELLGTNIDIIERMSHYFYPIVILLIPKVYENIVDKFNKKIVLIAIVAFSILFFFNVMNNNGGEFLPYHTIFEEIF